MLADAQELDAQDPLREFRDRFVIDDPELIYLDGNSLGRLPKATIQLQRNLIEIHWGSGLIRSWSDWLDLPQRLGNKIAKLIGVQEGEVLVCDSTSVNFYKLVMAALELRSDRTEIVTDEANFPSDLYLLQGCAKDKRKRLTILPENTDIAAAITEDTAILTLSHTSFKSAVIHDMQALTEAAHRKGALVIWDLSHSVGAMPLDLSQADMAVGCTYKYLNGGPGAPAFLYVRKDLQSKIDSPIWGWFGQKNPFDLDLKYEPAEGITRFLAGTPTILSMAAIEPGVDLVLEAGLDRIREKSVKQTEYLLGLCKDLDVSINSPLDSTRRGSHISIGHPEALRIDRALIEEMKVIPDFRYPDNIRLGIAPLYTRYEDLRIAVERIRQVIDDRIYEKYSKEKPAVT